MPYAAITIRYCHSKFTILYFIIQKTKSILIHNYFRNKSIIVEKYWLPAVRIQNPAGLRRWNYLPHPSPLLSPSPLSGSRGQKMRAQREGAEFYIWGGSLPPPLPGCRPPAAPPLGGRGGSHPPRISAQKKIIFIYI